MNKIHLNIFTNSSFNKDIFDILKRTKKSFDETFGKLEFTIYCDRNPNIISFDEYYNKLKKAFGKDNIIITNSLAEGYLHSINNAKTKYLFQLENDWEFNQDLIKHNLEEIIDLIEKNKIFYFAFNRNKNEYSEHLKKWQTKFMPHNDEFYCETDNISNMPHILEVKYYKNNLIKFIKDEGESNGIENNLEARGIMGAVYGPENYPPTINHTKGRGNFAKTYPNGQVKI